MRRLSTIRRHVALDRMDEYLAAWQNVRACAEALGARAWVFRGTEHQDRMIEFIEWTGDIEPLENEAVAEALAELSAYGSPVAAEEWEQAE